MAKTTKQRSHDKGETTVKPVRKKTASGKTAAKKVTTKSRVTSKKGATKKATAKKAVAKKAVTKKAAIKTQRPTKKTVARKANAIEKAAPKRKRAARAIANRHITSDDRRHMIAEAAYLRAESQGFLSDEHEDWLYAETAVDSLLTRQGVIVTD